jgi:hypothetical protein
MYVVLVLLFLLMSVCSLLLLLHYDEAQGCASGLWILIFNNGRKADNRGAYSKVSGHDSSPKPFNDGISYLDDFRESGNAFQSNSTIQKAGAVSSALQSPTKAKISTTGTTLSGTTSKPSSSSSVSSTRVSKDKVKPGKANGEDLLNLEDDDFTL